MVTPNARHMAACLHCHHYHQYILFIWERGVCIFPVFYKCCNPPKTGDSGDSIDIIDVFVTGWGSRVVTSGGRSQARYAVWRQEQAKQGRPQNVVEQRHLPESDPGKPAGSPHRRELK